MSAPTSTRRKREATAAEPDWTAGTTEQELIGLTADGRKVLWSNGRVRPIGAFPRSGPFIKGGHYVVDIDGHDITAHCSSTIDGDVIVQLMCSNASRTVHPVEEVEAHLRGQVVKDPVEEADICRRLDGLIELLNRRNAAPGRHRGYLRKGLLQ